jgi:hypothetical protein
MTKYILAGGNERRSEAYGERLAREVCKGRMGPLKILSSFFADPTPWQWEVRYRDWGPWFKQYFGSDVSYDYAQPETFSAQVRASDVVYLHGGDNETIFSSLRAYADFEEMVQDKIVIGSSAGANYLSELYWTRSKRQVAHGSGILPLGVMVHYGSLNGGFPGDLPVDWSEADTRMETALKAEPLYRIKEGGFIVITQ